MALIATGQVNLPQWLSHIPCRGLYAQSKQRRVRRWLGNSRINVHRLYKPLIASALAHWQEPVIYLSLDTSLFWEQYCLIRLAVVHRGRALPLAWRVLSHPSASVAFGEYQMLLHQAAGCLPPGVKVIVLADRGFVHTDAMDFIRQQLGWHYRIRLKSDMTPGFGASAKGEVNSTHCISIAVRRFAFTTSNYTKGSGLDQCI